MVHSKVVATTNAFECVSYQGCTKAPVRWCEHNIGGYNGTTHGWPPIASPRSGASCSCRSDSVGPLPHEVAGGRVLADPQLPVGETAAEGRVLAAGLHGTTQALRGLPDELGVVPAGLPLRARVAGVVVVRRLAGPVVDGGAGLLATAGVGGQILAHALGAAVL